VLWQKEVHRALPHEGGHISASLASASPVTDGERVYAFFGSFGLYALDFDGELQWQKQLGAMQTKHAHGEGSSPALDGDTLVVNWDHEGPSFLVAFDTATGEERWRTPRPEPTSWASPIIVHHGGGRQVIVSGTERVRSYDLATGKELWQCGGLSANVVATPVAADGRVFVASSYDTRAMFAIALDGAEGDITGSKNVLWSRTERTPYVPSPLLYDGALYFLRHYQGVLTRVEAATGHEPAGPIRLPGIRNIYASPVGAAGRLYIADRQGATIVLSHAEKPEILAINRLPDRFDASPVPVGDALLLRGEKKLWCLAEAGE
jgi:outer membrane protein assembly factor BamB